MTALCFLGEVLFDSRWQTLGNVLAIFKALYILFLSKQLQNIVIRIKTDQ